MRISINSLIKRSLLFVLLGFVLVSCSNEESSSSHTPSIPAPTSLDYGSDEVVLLVNEEFDSLTPLFNGTIDTWTISPQLPTGLLFDNQSGVISGLPTNLLEETRFEVIASNESGTDSTDFVLSVTVSKDEIDLYPSSSAHIETTGIIVGSINPLVSDISFRLSGEDFSNSSSDFLLSVNEIVVDTSEFVLSENSFSGSIDLSDGRNELAFKAYDTLGRPIHHTIIVWAGNNDLTINLVDEYGIPVDSETEVQLKLVDDDGFTIEKTSDNGIITFSNLPSRTLLLKARNNTNNMIGFAGVLGNQGTSNLTLIGIKEASNIPNNDISQGLNGWESSANSAEVVEHQENVGPQSNTEPKPQTSLPLDRTERHITHQQYMSSVTAKANTTSSTTSSFSNQDIRLNTTGNGVRTLSRTFEPAYGTTNVTIRYRFVTSEIPGGYFGSEYNDYFAVSLKTGDGISIASESSSMNALGLNAFDLNGSTNWRAISVPVDANSGVIQADISVANVGDELYDSFVEIDFIEERIDQVFPSLSWNDTNGGIDLTYEIRNGALEATSDIEVFWANGSGNGSQIGSAFYIRAVEAGTAQGNYGPFPISGSILENEPTGMNYILAISGSNIDNLRDVRIVYGANADSTVVSSGMIDIVKDGLRVAGQDRATITSTARLPEDQARAMFNNLINPSRGVTENINNQLSLYAPPGDAVINVFAGLVEGLSREDIIQQRSIITQAMIDEINAQGCEKVSRHCADPSILSVIDVGQSAFGQNGQLFEDSVRVRASRFINEPSNGAYHIEY